MEMINPYSFPGLKMAGLSREKYPYLSYEKHLLTRDEIIDVVCKECDITFDQIVSDCRKTEIVNGRKILSAALKIKLNLTLVSIGNLMGGRDHTTVRNLLLKFKDHCAYDDVFRKRASLILYKLGEDLADSKIRIKDNR
jgi:chromosomal replication initiator protein